MLKKISSVAYAIFCLVAITRFSPTLQKDDSDKEFVVVGYLPEWRYESANYDTLSQYLTHLLLFSLEPTPSGEITALDRLPSTEVFKEIQRFSAENNTEVLICFGGNGRSAGFSQMVKSAKARSRFVTAVVDLCEIYGLSGVDYNWEYPGYAFGRGYKEKELVDADYRGLKDLVLDTRKAFLEANKGKNKKNKLKTITMAYYPDTRQEQLLVDFGISDIVDYMHSMSYDQSGEHHSTLAFGKKTADQAKDTLLPLRKVTLGLPFYGRHRSGNWVTYEDIVQKHSPLPSHVDIVRDDAGMKFGFNGRDTIKEKVRYAKKLGLGGVMVWEAGQDCRIQEVTRSGQTHVVTCPDGPASSLLVAISEVLQEGDKPAVQYCGRYRKFEFMNLLKTMSPLAIRFVRVMIKTAICYIHKI